MTTILLTESTCLPADSFAATVGFFDGVHRGHRFLMGQLRDLAVARGLKTMAVTFSRHPRSVVQPQWEPNLLSSQEEKELLLSQTGIDVLVVLPFDKQMACLTAHDFMERVLSRQLGVSLLLTGYDNHFGSRTDGCCEGFDDYVAYGRELGIEVVAGKPLVLGTRAVSSSLVRHLLAEGRVEEAADSLGRYYELEGTVEHGEQQGRKMGFPTANLHLTDSRRVMPASGVYAVSVSVDGENNQRVGMTNIGTRPTFGGDHLTIETNIIHFNGDLYQRHLRIAFLARLRDEQFFAESNELARQMAADANEAQLIFNNRKRDRQ